MERIIFIKFNKKKFWLLYLLVISIILDRRNLFNDFKKNLLVKVCYVINNKFKLFKNIIIYNWKKKPDNK